MNKHRNEDRISALPEALIHYIFFFMDMRDVVNTSTLSKRFKYLWMSTPYLNFECSYSRECDCNVVYRRCNKCIDEWCHFVDFVDRVLLLRGSSNIFKFKLSSSLTLEASRVKTWIITALVRNAEELYFNSVVHEPHYLDHKSFTSKVRELSLIHFQIKVPFSRWTNAFLKNLELVYVTFILGNADGEFILNCPVLEYLKMRDCRIQNLRNFTVLGPILSRLELCHLHCEGDDKPCKLKICTPNLKSLRCTGRKYFDYSLENLSSLKDAHVDLYTYNEVSSKYWMGRKECAQCLIKVLSGIYNVRALSISTLSVENLTGFQDLFAKFPDFRNIRKVVLVDSPSNADRVNALVNFLERLPSMKTLIWKGYEDEWFLSSIAKVEEYGANMSIQKMFSGLETFEIWDPLGTGHELKFAKCLLERAIVLKEMIIKTGSLDEERITDFNAKLLSFPRASSRVRILFQ